MSEQANLYRSVAGAWRAFESAASLKSRVSSAIPILFFGDLSAYLTSSTRVLTVGLNPSSCEFPAKYSFHRFPLAEGISSIDQDRYIQALSAYFCNCPYRKWFNAFEPMLRGMEVSYYEGQPSTALHTDICSPVATDPTWSCLDSEQQKALKSDGGPLWHNLLRELRPQIVCLSIARQHLSRIEFEAITGWNTVHVFKTTKYGSRRVHPVKICARWYEIIGNPVLFLFVPAKQVPLGHLDDSKKRRTGAIALDELKRGPIAPD